MRLSLPFVSKWDVEKVLNHFLGDDPETGLFLKEVEENGGVELELIDIGRIEDLYILKHTPKRYRLVYVATPLRACRLLAKIYLGI